MSTKAKCEKLAKEKGVDILLSKSWLNSYDLQSPKGFVFGNLCHAVYGEAETMKEVWQAIWDDLQNLEPCNTENCDECQQS
jgi:hypothetical protein